MRSTGVARHLSCPIGSRTYVRASEGMEQQQARRIRADGWPLRKIALELSVAIGSVSVWVRDIPVPSSQKQPPPRPERTSAVGGTMSGSRRCGRCGKELPLTNFNRHLKGRQWWCRDCYREYFRARGQLHQNQTLKAKRRRQATARAFVDEYLRSHPCTDCGERDPIVLEFDHLGPKRGNVASLAFEGLSLAPLQKEIAACEVVCVNCHRRRSADRSKSWRLDPTGIERNPSLLPGERRNMDFVRDLLLRSECVDCGRAELVALEFDHIGEKRANVVQLARRGCSLNVLKREISRCQVRCGNCHRRRTVAGIAPLS